jgi:hypothetical protein
LPALSKFSLHSIESLDRTSNNNCYKIEIEGLSAAVSTMEEAVLKEKRMAKAKTTTPEATKKTRKPAKTTPTHDDIAARAYQIYQERGYTAGDPMQDWLQAERELAGARPKASRKTKVVSIAA